MKKPIFVISGKRKTAIAKAFIFEGDGLLMYNGISVEHLPFYHRLSLIEPLALARQALGTINIDFIIRTSGGGKEGQIQAARLAVAKALVKATRSPELKSAFIAYDRNLLVADTRRKETYKPGDSKARAKRQKSYR